MEKITIRRQEVWRYLGLGDQKPDAMLADKIESACAQLEAVMVPKEIHMRLPLHIQDEETFFLQNHSFQSRDMVRHLKNCQEVVLFAATLGTGVDQLIRRSEVLDMSMAVILQACAAEAIESWCDMCEAELSKEMENEHLYLRPRFSPGYGDFSIHYQQELLQMLQTPKRIGLTVTENYLMVPIKSVSALIGLTTHKESCHVHKCQSCPQVHCPFRKV